MLTFYSSSEGSDSETLAATTSLGGSSMAEVPKVRARELQGAFES